MHNDHFQCSSRYPSHSIWLDLQTYKAHQTTITDQAQTLFFHPFDFEFTFERCLLPALLRLSPLIDRRFRLKMTTSELVSSLNPTQLCGLLELFNLNFAYDDKVEKIVNELSQPPANVYNDPAHLGLFIDFSFQIDHFRVNMTTIASQKFLIFDFGSVEMTLKRYNDFFMTLEVVGSRVNAEIEESRWEVLSQQTEYVDLPVLRTSTSPAFHFHLSKLYDSSKTLHISLHSPLILLDFRLFPAFSSYFSQSSPEYSTETPCDYLGKYRPEAEDTHWVLPEQWTAPQLALSLEVADAVVALQQENVPTGLGVTIKNVHFALNRTSESQLLSAKSRIEAGFSRDMSLTDLHLITFPFLSSPILPPHTKLSNAISLTVGMRQAWENGGWGEVRSKVHCESANLMLSLQDVRTGYEVCMQQKSLLPLFPVTKKPQNEQVLRKFETVMEISLEESTFLVVNRAKKGIFPLVHILIPSATGQTRSSLEGLDSEMEVYVAVRAYNVGKDHWEPVIEPVHCLMSVTQHESDRSQLVAHLVVGESDEGLELTLSEGVIDSLYRALVQFSPSYESSPEVLLIKNCTGYPVSSLHCNQHLSIDPNSQVALQVNSYDEFFAFTPAVSQILTLVLHLPNMQKAQLNPISVTKFHTTILKYASDRQISASLYRDLDGKRVLILQSPLSFINKTETDLRIISENRDIFSIPTQETCGLPMECGGTLEFVPLNSTCEGGLTVSVQDLLRTEVIAT